MSTTEKPRPNTTFVVTPTFMIFFQLDDNSNEINDDVTSHYDDLDKEEILGPSAVTTTEYTIEIEDDADTKDTLGI